MLWSHQEREISRRAMLRYGLLGTAGLMMGPGLLSAAATKPATMPSTRAAGSAKAKSVIQIWCWGGPPHTDIWDPKPEAGRDYCGPLDTPIETNVAGVRIGQLLPLLAQQADKYSIIRSMTHGNNGHETAAYITQTGRQPGDGTVYPSMGAVVSLYRGYGAGYTALVPPYIVLTEAQGRFSEAGFLGTKYKPLATGGNPAAPRFEVEGIYARGITEQRQIDRRELLGNLNTLGNTLADDPQILAAAEAQRGAYDLILGDARKVFDPNEESAEVRDAYGRNKFGQSCLVARRLIEQGVPYVTINYGGWDTHKQHFQTMRNKLPEMDRAMSTLLKELSERGLLESTIVWWCGEFGRTPKVDWQPPWDGGRHHFGSVFSAMVAGGGFKGGQVVGASDEKGMNVRDRPVSPADLIGTMYEMLAIDPQATLPHPQQKVIRATPPQDEGTKTGGRLKEIV